MADPPANVRLVLNYRGTSPPANVPQANVPPANVPPANVPPANVPISDAIYDRIFSIYSSAAKPIAVTRNARVYGEAGYDAFTNEKIPIGKSGLTPSGLFTYSEAFPRSSREWRQYSRLSKYQRAHMHGFTTAELRDLLAISNPLARPSTLGDVRTSRSGKEVLDISISPALGKSNWRICVPCPPPDDDYRNNLYFPDLETLQASPNWLARRPRIYGTVDGYMDFAYDPIWEVLLPAIRLASRVLQNIHFSIFYDTLFHGARIRVDDDRKPPGYDADLWEMWPRTGAPTIASARSDWVAFSKDVHLFVNPDQQNMCANAITFSKYDNLPGAHIGIDYRLIVPLLSNKLTQSERDINSWNLADTILHELAHAIIIWKNKVDAKAKGEVYKWHGVEPYFRDEHISEVGWSAENACWGGELCIQGPGPTRGQSENELAQIREVPAMFSGRQDFGIRDTYLQGNYGPAPPLDMEDVWDAGVDTFKRYVVRLDFLQDIQTPEFWDIIVAKYGVDEVLKDNVAPFFIILEKTYSDLETVVPGSYTRRGAMREAAVTAIEHHMGSMSRRNDPWWRFKDARVKRTKRIIEDFEMNRKQEFRAWRRYQVDQRDPAPIPTDWGPRLRLNLSMDEIIMEIATSRSTTVYELRKRSRKFIEGLVGDYLEDRGIPRNEYFNFKKENVLLTENQAMDPSFTAADLDVAVKSILAELRTSGNDITEVLQLARESGDATFTNALAGMVRNWLRRVHIEEDYFDAEMVRRSKDPDEEVFYIKPLSLTDISNTITARGVTAQAGFDLAERIRDHLESMGHPRTALDAEMEPGAIPVVIVDLDAEKRIFMGGILTQYNWTMQDALEMQNRDHIKNLWRRWLVARRYSTDTVLFE